MPIRVLHVKEKRTPGVLTLSGARDSPLGNPIVLHDPKDRPKVLEAFRALLESHIVDPRFGHLLDEARALMGKEEALNEKLNSEWENLVESFVPDLFWCRQEIRDLTTSYGLRCLFPTLYGGRGRGTSSGSDGVLTPGGSPKLPPGWEAFFGPEFRKVIDVANHLHERWQVLLREGKTGSIPASYEAWSWDYIEGFWGPLHMAFGLLALKASLIANPEKEIHLTCFCAPLDCHLHVVEETLCGKEKSHALCVPHPSV